MEIRSKPETRQKIVYKGGVEMQGSAVHMQGNVNGINNNNNIMKIKNLC